MVKLVGECMYNECMSLESPLSPDGAGLIYRCPAPTRRRLRTLLWEDRLSVTLVTGMIGAS